MIILFLEYVEIYDYIIIMKDYSLILEERMAYLNRCLSSLEFQDPIPLWDFLHCTCSPILIQEILTLSLQLIPLQLASSIPFISVFPSFIQ